MAVIRTGDIFKSFTFDGEDSRNYGIYITGEAVYNAPERSVEMISIPGRNGAYALDNGRFENIEVTYPAGVFGETEADFAAAVSALRNMLCSRRGYKRLSDDYNTGEYREAVYKSGLEVEPAQLRAGEFEITFECKPQRFLTSGETKQTLTSGDTLTNPTLFESSPLLTASGLGDISINSDVITITNAMVGDIVLSSPKTETLIGNNSSRTVYVALDASDALNTGDTITISGVEITFSHTMTNNIKTAAVASATDCSVTSQKSGKTATYRIVVDSVAYTKGTSGTFLTASASFDVTDVTDALFSFGLNISVGYSNVYGKVFVMLNPTLNDHAYSVTIPSIIGTSTKSALPDMVYIDLDIGEAYYIVDDVPVSMNNVVQLPAELPTLKPGANVITFDNTFTKIEIVPRWWKI